MARKLPLKPRQFWGIRVHLQMGVNIREPALFNPAVDSKLRGCDLVKLLALAQGMGVPAERVSDADTSNEALARGLQTPPGHSWSKRWCRLLGAAPLGLSTGPAPGCSPVGDAVPPIVRI